jgi:hypothetical protein
MRKQHLGSIIVWVAACSAASGCAAPDVPTVPDSIQLFASADVVELATGSVQEIGVNLVRSSAFGGDVLITVDSVPSGIRALVGAEQTDGVMTSDLLTFATDSGTQPGDYLVRVRGSSFGVADAFASVIVRVEAEGTQLYTLQARPLAVLPGDSATTLLNIIRFNFAEMPVTLDLLSAPEALHASVTPSPNARAISRLSVHADATLRPGVYNVVVRGMATGKEDRVAVVPVNVLEAVPAAGH